MSDELPFDHGFGLRRDAPDRRDRLMFRAVPNIDVLSDHADCSDLLPPVMDQHAIGACVGYSTAACLHGVMRKDGHRRPFVPSPVFLYREARVLGGYVEEDCGSEIRNAFKAANKLGLPPMSNIKPRFTAADMPDGSTSLFPPKSVWLKPATPGALADAERRQMISYHRLEGLPDLLQCLADGWPATLGFEVFRSFYGPYGPLYDAPDPRLGERALGGHAVCAFGYDKPSRRVLIRNSWGPDAHEGRPDFTLSFDCIEKHAWDMWSARWVEGGRSPRPV